MIHSVKRYFSTFYLLSVAAFILCIGLCQCAIPAKEEPVNASQINTSHLDALYSEIKVGEDTIGYIHIYAEYPDYHLVGDDDEGFACVDDASRASIFYLRQYAESGDAEHLRKGRMLVKFLLAMQAPNGYYYNFIWPDGRIHTDGITSRPEPNFWSWRVLWAFGEAMYILDKGDPLKEQIGQQREKLVTTILNEQAFKSTATDTTNGWTFPTWLPKICGTDQASIVLIGLSWMVQQSALDGAVQKKDVIELMRHFAEGIIMMQFRSPGDKRDGAFLSWENVWHAYANIQSYGLLTAGQTLKDTSIINHALYEIKTFYPSILSNGRLDHFWVRELDGKLESYDAESFPQIAYGVRPMVWASLKAYLITGDTQFRTQAQELSKWFSGNNPAKTPMYDSATGRGYDGISGPDQINKNAGAESTIEALLTLQALEKYDR
ncbi:MAG: hypothetical protein SH808_07025 [Saprospiraceae bacterium]|nr:hypothetical protein [Saprospiraceae bacterium]